MFIFKPWKLGQGVFEIAGVTDERPSRSVALSKVAWRSTKASQAADQCAALDIGTQLRAARLQDLEKAAADIAPKCCGEPLSRNRGKDAVTSIRRDHPRRGILCEVPMEAILGQVFKVAKDDARGIRAFNVGSGLDELCNGRLTAISPDDDVRANGHARPAGVLQRDAVDPAVRREQHRPVDGRALCAEAQRGIRRRAPA